jgi:hypothetical protein
VVRRREGADILALPMDGISVRQVLEVLADFDGLGGASLRLVAWELFVEEQRVAKAWEQMLAGGLLKPAGRDPADDEQLWRLTAGGWAARGERRGRA